MELYVPKNSDAKNSSSDFGRDLFAKDFAIDYPDTLCAWHVEAADTF